MEKLFYCTLKNWNIIINGIVLMRKYFFQKTALKNYLSKKFYSWMNILKRIPYFVNLTDIAVIFYDDHKAVNFTEISVKFK